jgi:hypothetical protein
MMSQREEKRAALDHKTSAGQAMTAGNASVNVKRVAPMGRSYKRDDSL